MKTAGIDIGGTNLRCAIFDENHEIIDKLKIDNDRQLSPQDNLARLAEFIKAAGQECRGIGIGCPGPLDIRGGRILTPPNLPGWHGFEIVRYFEQATGLKTVLNNDANVAGLAEARLGAGNGYESVFYITVSTGVGGAYVYRGEVVNGANSTAAEIFNLIVCDNAYTRSGMNPGALELQCAGPGLARQAAEIYHEPMTAETLFARYNGGDSLAAQVVERAADMLARGMANIACVVDPDIFILGGSVALRNPGFVELACSRARKYLIHPDALRVEMARFTDDAGLVGASLLL